MISPFHTSLSRSSSPALEDRPRTPIQTFNWASAVYYHAKSASLDSMESLTELLEWAPYGINTSEKLKTLIEGIKKVVLDRRYNSEILSLAQDVREELSQQHNIRIITTPQHTTCRSPFPEGTGSPVNFFH